MNENRIQEIANDIENYRQAIENAEGALEEAEREICEELADNAPEDTNYPE